VSDPAAPRLWKVRVPVTGQHRRNRGLLHAEIAKARGNSPRRFPSPHAGGGPPSAEWGVIRRATHDLRSHRARLTETPAARRLLSAAVKPERRHRAACILAAARSSVIPNSRLVLLDSASWRIESDFRVVNDFISLFSERSQSKQVCVDCVLVRQCCEINKRGRDRSLIVETRGANHVPVR